MDVPCAVLTEEFHTYSIVGLDVINERPTHWGEREGPGRPRPHQALSLKHLLRIYMSFVVVCYCDVADAQAFTRVVQQGVRGQRRYCDCRWEAGARR